MDRQLDSEIRELNAQRARQLRRGLTIPLERRDALRDAVLRLQEKRTPLSTARRYVVQLFAVIDGRAGVPLAAACVVLVATTSVWLGLFATGRDVSRLSRSTAMTAPPAATEVIPAGGRESALSLRIGAAELTQLQTGLLAQHRAFISGGMDDVSLAHLAPDNFQLDGGFELAP